MAMASGPARPPPEDEPNRGSAAASWAFEYNDDEGDGGFSWITSSEYSDSDSSLSAPLMLDSMSSLSDSAEEEPPGRAIILDSEDPRPGGASTSWTKAVPVNLPAAPESSGSTSEAWPVMIDAPPLREAAAAAETMAEVGATYKRRKHVRAGSVDGMSMDNIERSAWSPLPFELAYQQLCRPDYCASGPRPDFIADVMR